MNPIDATQQSEDYRRIEKAIRFIEDNFQSRPTLDQIAARVNLSRFHFDRLFKRWAGISPMRFLGYLTLDYTKRKLAESSSLLDAALGAGLSGPGRLHDLFVTFEAMTPGEFKRKGAGLKIRYGFSPTPFGDCLMARTDRGICHLGFLAGGHQSDAVAQLQHFWPGAGLVESEAAIAMLARRLFDSEGRHGSHPFHLQLKGTNFQVNVWRALLAIPAGSLVSYQDIAACIGRPSALRAVANAVAINPVACLIPCHRVSAKSGLIHGYRWGSARKKAMVGWEAAGIRGNFQPEGRKGQSNSLFNRYSTHSW